MRYILTEEEAKARDDRVGAKRLEPYKGRRIKHKYECQECKKELLCCPHEVWRNKQIYCKKCAHKLQGLNRKLTEKDAKARDDAVGAKRLEPYQGNSIKHKYECQECKRIFLCSPHKVWGYKQIHCRKCAHQLKGIDRRLTIEDIDNILLKAGFTRDEDFEYKNDRTKVNLICHCDKKFTTKITSVQQGLTKSCGHCNDPKVGDKNGNITDEKIAAYADFVLKP